MSKHLLPNVALRVCHFHQLQDRLVLLNFLDKRRRFLNNLRELAQRVDPVQTDVARFLPSPIFGSEVIARPVVQVNLVWTKQPGVEQSKFGEIASFTIIVDDFQLSVTDSAEKCQQLNTKAAAVQWFITQLA